MCVFPCWLLWYSVLGDVAYSESWAYVAFDIESLGIKDVACQGILLVSLQLGLVGYSVFQIA